MIITQKHNIESNTVRKNHVIVNITDLHFNEAMPVQKLINICAKIKRIRPDYITFTGDICFNETQNYDDLLMFFGLLGKIAPVYLIYGNHDLMRLKVMSKSVNSLEWEPFFEEELFANINNVPGITVMDNTQQYLDEYNMLLTAINLDFDHYETKMGSSADFVEKVNKAFPNGLPAETFNTIMCHTPNAILDKKYFKQLHVTNGADLILCGHNHNGAVPLGFGIFLPKNMGLIDPYGNLFPRLARGEVKIDEVLGIIGGPLTPIAESLGFKAKLINMAIQSRIDVVHVKRLERKLR